MKSKKTYNIFSSIVLTALLFVGCEHGAQKVDDPDSVPVPNYNTAEPTDEVYKDVIELENSTDLTLTIPITSSKDYAWEAKSNEDWCRITNEMPLVGDQDLNLEFDLNRTNENRWGSIVLALTTDYGTSNSHITFNQTCFPLRQIELTNPSGNGVENLTRAGADVVATLKYNYEVDITVEYDGTETGWITLPTDHPAVLDEDGSLCEPLDYVINAAEYDNPNPQSTRKATVVFSNVGAGLEGDEEVVKRIEINQNAEIAPLHLDVTTVNSREESFLGDGGQIDASLQYNYDVNVSIEYENGSDWIELITEDPIRLDNGGTLSESSTYVIKVLSYDSNTPRKAKVVFTNVGPEGIGGVTSVVQKISITQIRDESNLPAGASSFKDNFSYMAHNTFSSIITTYESDVDAANWLVMHESIVCYSYDWGNGGNNFTNAKLCNGGTDLWMVTNALSPKDSENDIFSFWWSNQIFSANPADDIEVLYTTDEITATNYKGANWISIEGTEFDGAKPTGIGNKSLFQKDLSSTDINDEERVFFAIKYRAGEPVREYFIDDVRFGIAPKDAYALESDD